MVNTHNTADFFDGCAAFPQRLIEALGRLQAHTITTVTGSIYVYDLVDQCTVYATSSVSAILGYTDPEINAMGAIGMAALIHPDDLLRVSDHYQRSTTLRAGEVLEIEYRMKRPDGAWCWLRSHETVLVQAIDGFPLQVLGIIQDTTQQKQIEEQQNQAEALWDTLSYLIDHRPELIMITNQNGVITYVNQAFEQMTGYSAAEAIGKTPAILKSGQHDTAFYRQLWNRLQTGQTFAATFINRKKDGSLFCEEKIITPLQDWHGRTYLASSGRVVQEYWRSHPNAAASAVSEMGRVSA
jgi:PAS domain S-box-containing protein